jgi:hypothetical protein
MARFIIKINLKTIKYLIVMRLETVEFITLTVLNIGLIYFKKNNMSIYGIRK